MKEILDIILEDPIAFITECIAGLFMVGGCAALYIILACL